MKINIRPIQPSDNAILAKELHRQYESELLSKCTPIMVGSDKKSLIFCVNLADKNENRVAYECGDNIYRVVVEKIQFK
jgi:hypothetical protein